MIRQSWSHSMTIKNPKRSFSSSFIVSIYCLPMARAASKSNIRHVNPQRNTESICACWQPAWNRPRPPAEFRCIHAYVYKNCPARTLSEGTTSADMVKGILGRQFSPTLQNMSRVPRKPVFRFLDKVKQRSVLSRLSLLGAIIVTVMSSRGSIHYLNLPT